MHCSNRSLMFTCSSRYSKWFTASYCCCSVVCLWLWNKVKLLLARLDHNTTLPLDVTSESSWLASLLCAVLPVDLWRRAQCRFPAGFLVGQQILHWSLSPLWLLPLVWILGKPIMQKHSSFIFANVSEEDSFAVIPKALTGFSIFSCCLRNSCYSLSFTAHHCDASQHAVATCWAGTGCWRVAISHRSHLRVWRHFFSSWVVCLSRTWRKLIEKSCCSL